MRYNDGRGYIFIDSNKGDKLLQPPSKEMEGQNFYNFEDLKGNKFMHDIVIEVSVLHCNCNPQLYS